TMGQQSLKLYHNLKNNNHADMATYSAEGVFRTADYVMNVVIDSGVASLTVALLNTYGAPVAIPIWAVAYIAKNYYLTPAWDRMEAVQKPIIAGLMRQTKNNWWFDPQTNTLKAQIQYSAELHGTFKNNFAFSIPLATQKINKNNLTSINFSNTHGYNNSPLSENNLPSPPRPPAAAAIPVAQVTALLTNQAHAASQQLDESTRLLFSLGENPIPPTSNGINPQPWHFAFNPIDTGESNQPNTLYVGYDRTRGLGDYSAEQGPTVKASLWRATAAGGIVFAPALSISIPLDITLKMLGIYTMPVLIGGLCLKKLVDFIHLKALPADEQSAQKIDLALTKYINAHQRNLSWHNYNPRRLLFNWDTVENSRTDELKAQIQNGIKANANNQTIIHHYRALDYAVNTKNYDLSKKWQINAKEAVDQFNHYLNQRTADYNQAMQSKNYSGAKNAAAEILTWLPEAPMSSVMYGLAIESQDVNRTQDYFNKAFKLCNTPEQQKIVGEHYVPYLWRKCETAPSSGNIEQLRGHLKPYINTDGKLRQVYLSTFIYDFQYKKNIEDPNQIIAHMKQMQRNMGYLTPHDRAPFARALYHLKAYSESFTAYGQEGGASGLDDAIKSICGLHIPHEAQASANALMQTCESLQKSINLTPHNHETLGEYAREIAILSGHALAQYYSQKDLAQYVFYLEYLSQDALLGKSAEIADILLSAYYCLAKNNCGDKVELLQKSQALYPHLSDPQKEHITTQLKIAWLEKQCNSAGVNEKYITLHATLKNQFATGQG
ncbi:MAG TPA: hypothetical protein VI522_06085, partial [Gammaproteobacteria bacterium]|nr:hypothetical protein [Gammaproteobacteria bacterium]